MANAQPAKPNTAYPVGEQQPENVRTRSGRPLADLTLANLLAGEVTALTCIHVGVPAPGGRSRLQAP